MPQMACASAIRSCRIGRARSDVTFTSVGTKIGAELASAAGFQPVSPPGANHRDQVPTNMSRLTLEPSERQTPAMLAENPPPIMKSHTAVVKAEPGAEPRLGRRLGNGDTGHPVAEFRWGWGCARTMPEPEDLLEVTLADFESSDSEQLGQVRIGVMTHLGGVFGPWEQAVARYRALQDAGGRRRDWMRVAWAWPS
jgi:hypothetical protein